jgi:DNA-binding PadR family transcriptional regulator
MKNRTDSPTTAVLTEMEGAALAVIARDGPCTAYSIKHAFEQSPSDDWSGSAGAVYPMIKRLEAAGLIDQQAAEGGRKARQLQLTSQGQAQMKAWLLDYQRAIAPGFDPLRTRLHFLDLVADDTAREFVDGVRGALTEQLQAPPAPSGELKLRAEQLYAGWIQARLAWLASL